MEEGLASSSLRPTAGLWRMAPLASGLFPQRLYPSARLDPRCSATRWRSARARRFDADSHSGKSSCISSKNKSREDSIQVEADDALQFVMEILMLYERPLVRALLGPTNSTASSPSFPGVPSFRARNMTPMFARASAASWRGSIRGACPPPTLLPRRVLARVPHYIIGRI